MFYIFWILDLYQIQDLLIVSPILWVILFHFMVSFEAQEFLILIRSHLSVLLLLLVLLVVAKKPFPNSRSQKLPPMFSFKSWIILALIFRSMQ